ncbi:MAG TPA: DUF192 domain-containing protein [Nitrososphaerales archaeon]
MVRLRVYFYVICAVAIILLLIASLLSGTKVVVEISGVKIYVEVADNQVKKYEGLMFRDNLGQNDGMIFPFSENGKYSFWMSNVKLPLDLIWINDEKTVVDITENAQPCKVDCPYITSREPAKYVVEVNGGFANRNGIRIGDKASFELK